MCGKIGQANPRNAIVTCPNCHQRIKHPLPFRVKIIKKENFRGQVGDRIEEDISNHEF